MAEKDEYLGMYSISEILRDHYEEALMQATRPSAVLCSLAGMDYKMELGKWEYEYDQIRMDKVHGPRFGPGRREHYAILSRDHFIQRMRTLVPEHHPGRVVRT